MKRILNLLAFIILGINTAAHAQKHYICQHMVQCIHDATAYCKVNKCISTPESWCEKNCRPAHR